MATELIRDRRRGTEMAPPPRTHRREVCQANATVTKLRILEKAQAADVKTLSEEVTLPHALYLRTRPTSALLTGMQLMTTRGAAANLYTA
eukprot:18141-Eustigmatos_ZCMA.PRE.1